MVELDLPGIDPEKVDIDVEHNVLTIRAERLSNMPDAANAIAAERSWGDANYIAGVLRLQIPIAEKAKPRKINVAPRGAITEQKKKSIRA